jgi:hypothetical protein
LKYHLITVKEDFFCWLHVISFVITWVTLKGRQDYSRLNILIYTTDIQHSLNWYTTFQYIHDHAGVAYPTAQFNPWRTIIKNLVFRKSFIYFRVDRFSISPQKYLKYKIAEKTSCLKKMSKSRNYLHTVCYGKNHEQTQFLSLNYKWSRSNYLFQLLI